MTCGEPLPQKGTPCALKAEHTGRWHRDAEWVAKHFTRRRVARQRTVGRPRLPRQRRLDPVLGWVRLCHRCPADPNDPEYGWWPETPEWWYYERRGTKLHIVGGCRACVLEGKRRAGAA